MRRSVVGPIGFRLALALALGCVRYEQVPDFLGPACQNRIAPTRSGPPLGTIQVDSFPTGLVTGRVRAEGAADGLAYAVVTIAGRVDTTDSVGRFALTDIAAGSYLVSVRRIGFASTRDSIRTATGGGMHVEVELRTAMLDGPCSGYGVVRVRKPWWKVW